MFQLCLMYTAVFVVLMQLPRGRRHGFPHLKLDMCNEGTQYMTPTLSSVHHSATFSRLQSPRSTVPALENEGNHVYHTFFAVSNPSA